MSEDKAGDVLVNKNKRFRKDKRTYLNSYSSMGYWWYWSLENWQVYTRR